MLFYKGKNQERKYIVMNLFFKKAIVAVFGMESLLLLYNVVPVYATGIESSLASNLTIASFPTEIEENILSVSKKEILAGKESADVIFYFQTNTDSEEFMLYQNDVAIGKLVDTGNYAEDGDDIKGDGIYSMKYTVDVTGTSATPTENKKVAYYSYDVRYGEAIVSNTVTIDIIQPFTEQELADMAKVDDAISQLLQSESYQSMDVMQRADAVLELLHAFVEEGIVDSVTQEEEKIKFSYASGAHGEVLLKPFDGNMDGSDPVTTTTTTETTTTATASTTTDATTTTTAATTEVTSNSTTPDTTTATTTTTFTDTTSQTTNTADIAETTTSVTNYKNITEDDFIAWAKNDYQEKTGVLPVNASLSENANGAFEITLTDENGNVLDVYTVDPVTATGTNQSGEEVNLPQTGVTSMKNWLLFFGSVLLLGFGLFMVKKSGFVEMKK